MVCQGERAILVRLALDQRGKQGVHARDWNLCADGRFFDLRNGPSEQKPLNIERLSAEAAEFHDRLSEALGESDGP